MKKILIIGATWPEPSTTGAGVRMLQIIDLFQAAGYDVHFASSSFETQYSFDLSTIDVTKHEILLNDASFNDFVKELDPIVALFDRFMTEEQYGWRVAQECPNCVKILDTEDLHFLRKAREKAILNELDIDLQSKIAIREISSILRSDLTLMISSYEIELLVEEFKIDKNLLFYLPFLVDEDKLSHDHPKFNQRSNFITIGNFLHSPNVDALKELKSNIWPGIRQTIPEAELHVFGAYSDKYRNEIEDQENGLILKGWAEDVKQTFNEYRLLLAPLRFGAGLKAKLFDSMIYGLPSITTSIGAEGLGNSSNWPGKICDDWTSFIKQSIKLYRDKSQWESSRFQTTEHLKRNFLKHRYSGLLIQKVNSLVENIQGARKDNFLGEILKHQMHQSTKFMSQWIEEKNKKS